MDRLEIPFDQVREFHDLLTTVHGYFQTVDMNRCQLSLVDYQWSPLTLAVEQELKRLENYMKDFVWQKSQEPSENAENPDEQVGVEDEDGSE